WTRTTDVYACRRTSPVCGLPSSAEASRTVLAPLALHDAVPICNGSFNISGASLRATGSLDHEATPTLSVRVRSSDGGGLWVEKRSEERRVGEEEGSSGMAVSDS